MGVRGLTKLITDNNNRFLIRDYRLHNIKIVIDADNLARALLEKVRFHYRSDRVGVNLVYYGKQVELFFDNLRKCDIEPVLVFDGAQTKEAVTSTMRNKKQFRAVQALFNPLVCAILDPPSVVHPACTGMILKSIAIEKQVQVVQCFLGGRKYIAKIANDCNGFVLSNDSDYFIFDVKRGVILIESLNFEDIKTQIDEKLSSEKVASNFYIECELFDQNHFVKAFPGLDKSCLPLIASIAGNDKSGGKLDILLRLIPSNDKAYYKNDGLRKLIEFLRNKSLEQNLDSLLALAGENGGSKIEELIRNSLEEGFSYYSLPKEDDFYEKISKLYETQFYWKYWKKFDVDSVDDAVKKEMRKLADWFRKKIETSNLTETCLQLQTDFVFLQPEMDDFTQQSAHNCFRRCLYVLSSLMLSSQTDTPGAFYDRKGDSMETFAGKRLRELKNYGSIDCLIYDVCGDLSGDVVTTKLTQSQKTAILLATFHTTRKEFVDSEAQYHKFLKPEHVREFAIVKLLLRYVELEDNITFQPRFRKSVLVTYLYYLHFGAPDVTTNTKADADESYLEFLDNLKRLTRKYCLKATDQWMITNYDITIVRNITQMQTAIRAYEELNAFLGNSLPTLRIHKWFNSCFIYNFAAIVEKENVQMPSFVADQ